MRSDEANPSGRGETRREFIRKTTTAAAVVAGAGFLEIPVTAREEDAGVAVVLDATDPVVKEAPVKWAAQQLCDAVAGRGVGVQFRDTLDQVPPKQECVLVSGRASALARPALESVGISLPDAPEALALGRGKIGERAILVAGGSDVRGLVYALLELADRVTLASANPIATLKAVKPVAEKPANAIRSVARAFVSDVEDKPWFNDRAFWSRYLTTLAAQRFNRFALMFGIGYDFTTNITDCYFHFTYPFLLAVPGYSVRAKPLPDAERDSNLAMLKFISEEAARRGLHFQLGVWTHAYQWTNSPQANYTIEGLTPQTQAPYCRDALRTLLKACPAISGVTFRIHGESGVPEGNYDLWKTIFDGVAQCGRRVEIDMHAKGMDQGMIDVALGTGMPVTISPKFWAEHMGLPYMQGAIRPTEIPRRETRDAGFFSRSSGSRSFLRYGYGDLLAEDRRYSVLHRIWPGTQRVLLWGDPATAAGYGRVSSFCGSNGVELFEPLFFKGRKGSGLAGGRDGYADAALRPKGGDFEKYLYTYRVWGRNFYNPDGDADGWQRLLRQQFGRGAEAAEGALASAGKILPLVTTAHCPSAANNNYWPEMYFNMAIVDAGRRNPYSDTPSPKRFGTVSPLDPEFFLTVEQFADELISGQSSGKYSPIWVARYLDDAAENAVKLLRKAKSRTHEDRGAEFRRLQADTGIQAGLGWFFAAKFRAAVLYALYERSNHRPALEEALKAYRDARAAYAELADLAEVVYRRDLTFGPEYYQRGHWLDRLLAIDADVTDLSKLAKLSGAAGAAALKVDRKIIDQALRAVLTRPKRDEPPPLAGLHTPPASFRRNEPLSIVAQAPAAGSRETISGMRLRYRRVNQAESWQMIDMEKSGAEFRGTIPGEYTNSPFPLQYHFQVRDGAGAVWLHPGLQPGWRGQPYFVVRQG